ncbi:MAG: VanZ family protein [Ruminococcaceae bacterium]|nr:VanZ family protein [Oscillospiraceae bacterium]
MKRWIQKHAILATLIPVLLVMLMIFCFSAQNGQDSGQFSGKITRFVVRLFVPEFDTWTAQMQDEVCSTVGLVVRKLGHFTEFFLLGFFLLLHIDAIGKKVTLRLPWLIAWGIGTLYAVTDELHQGFVGGRHPAILDVCIDSSGVIAGLLAMLVILWKIRRGSVQK